MPFFVEEAERVYNLSTSWIRWSAPSISLIMVATFLLLPWCPSPPSFPFVREIISEEGGESSVNRTKCGVTTGDVGRRRGGGIVLEQRPLLRAAARI